MKHQFLKGYQLAARRFATSHRIVGVTWAVVLANLEVLGRRSPSDVHDSLGVAALAGLVWLTAEVHRRDRIPLVARLVAWAKRAGRGLGGLDVPLGVDFRERPTLPRVFPGLYAGLLAGAAGLLGAIVPFVAVFPGAARHAVMSVSSSLYFVILAGFWVLLAGTSLVLLVFVLAAAHEWVVNEPRWRVAHREKIEMACATVFVAALSTAAVLAPVWIPLAAIGVTVVATIVTLLVPGAPSLLLVWQRKGTGDAAVVTWTQLVAAWGTVLAAILVAMTLLATGERYVGLPGTDTPVTSWLGVGVAWTGAMAYVLWSVLGPLAAFRYRFRDPARLVPTTIAVSGEPSDAIEQLAVLGFRVTDERPDMPDRDAVSVVVDPAVPRLSPTGVFERRPPWPLHLHPDDVLHPEIHHVLRQRDDVQRRRKILKGLERLMREAARRTFDGGHGFWIAPHWWFVAGLSRDSTNELLSIGPPYHRVMSLAARSHLRHVLRAAEVDLIFVEDGLKFRRLKRVFRRIFDTYDMLGGAARVDERHFDGIPGVKVAIHDFMMDNPYRDEAYPEVDYEEVGRARILHVFRDRGEGEDHVDTPADSDLILEPALR